MTSKAPPPKRPPSGAHPSVVAYRQKLQSLSDHASADLTELDRQLAEYLDEIRSDPPPATEDRPSTPGS